jgi:hypothetical protein
MEDERGADPLTVRYTVNRWLSNGRPWHLEFYRTLSQTHNRLTLRLTNALDQTELTLINITRVQFIRVPTGSEYPSTFVRVYFCDIENPDDPPHGRETLVNIQHLFLGTDCTRIRQGVLAVGFAWDARALGQQSRLWSSRLRWQHDFLATTVTTSRGNLPMTQYIPAGSNVPDPIELWSEEMEAGAAASDVSSDEELDLELPLMHPGNDEVEARNAARLEARHARARDESSDDDLDLSFNELDSSGNSTLTLRATNSRDGDFRVHFQSQRPDTELLRVVVQFREHGNFTTTGTWNNVSRVQFIEIPRGSYPGDHVILTFFQIWTLEANALGARPTEEMGRGSSFLPANFEDLRQDSLRPLPAPTRALTFSNLAIIDSVSTWESRLDWHLTRRNGTRMEGTPLRVPPPPPEMQPPPPLSLTNPRVPPPPPTNAAAASHRDPVAIISIAGARKLVQRDHRFVAGDMLDGRINGDYIRTSHIVNDHPVYVKIHGQQYVVPPMLLHASEANRNEIWTQNSTNRFCIMMTNDRSCWFLKNSAYANDPVGMGRISIPERAVSRDLADLARDYTLEVEDHPGATVRLKSIEQTMADIAAAATKHVERKNLRNQRFECQGCGEGKPFEDFIALPCGHAMMCRPCHERNIEILRENPEMRSNCTEGCSASRFQYHRVTEHSDYANLFMGREDHGEDDEQGDQPGDQPGHHQPSLRTACSNCYLITGQRYRQFQQLQNRAVKMISL